MIKTAIEKITERSYIDACIDGQTPVYCWLANGVRLAGTIHSHDLSAVFLRPLEAQSASEIMLAFKMQLTSIMPISARTMTRSGTQHLHGVGNSVNTGD